MLILVHEAVVVFTVNIFLMYSTCVCNYTVTNWSLVSITTEYD